jgi:hypothetical protein
MAGIQILWLHQASFHFDGLESLFDDDEFLLGLLVVYMRTFESFLSGWNSLASL